MVGEGKREDKLLNSFYSRCVYRREFRIKIKDVWRVRRIKYEELESGDIDVGLVEELRKER